MQTVLLRGPLNIIVDYNCKFEMGTVCTIVYLFFYKFLHHFVEGYIYAQQN